MDFYGFKVKQSQDYDTNGHRWPVTYVRVEAMTAINNTQVGFGYKKHQNKPQGTNNFKFFRKVETENQESGKKITFPDFFAVGDKVKVTGVSKGKGFAGVVKRHNFKGGPKTHGQSDRQRAPGSIGSTTTPGRVYKGKRMAGHMGNVNRTTTGLAVFKIEPENNLVLIKGLVPGSIGGMVKICKS